MNTKTILRTIVFKCMDGSLRSSAARVARTLNKIGVEEIVKTCADSGCISTDLVGDNCMEHQTNDLALYIYMNDREKISKERRNIYQKTYRENVKNGLITKTKSK